MFCICKPLCEFALLSVALEGWLLRAAACAKEPGVLETCSLEGRSEGIRACKGFDSGDFRRRRENLRPLWPDTDEMYGWIRKRETPSSMSSTLTWGNGAR